ncbi:MAG: gliding motility-associated ABC transporter ATP-binding subunit GldA [Lewinellaceae bacterium]|nr:gliding motility-associated ABC transporter ATP-binding subunit GldA [Lewinellaceae bacterium]
MSVLVSNLVKIYDVQRAVDGVSFEAHKGEVLGFLGPNGAGKTTTMKIITGYLPQTEGEATVCGFSVDKNPMEARARVGYLPENNPLYKDMYVREYLHFTAGIHKVSNPRKRVEEMIERTGLTSHRLKQIGELSKGYRQRVGLAQAMLHDPEVLILDEPTSGLDPNQIVEIRQLIKDLGKEKTVILSTHILAEVEAVCDRAIIINKGKLVADAPIEELKQRFIGQSVVQVEFAEKTDATTLKKIPGVQGVKDLGKHRWQLTAPSGQDFRPAVFRFAVEQKLTLLELHKEQYSVEDVFHQLTMGKDAGNL